MSGSQSQDRSEAANSKPHKLFITGMDGKAQIGELQAELRKVFSKYGQLVSVVPKKSYNHQYSYAFLDYKQDVDASVAMKKQNNSSILGAKITISLQDNSRRKKGTQICIIQRADGCYKCKKQGHFARDCRYADDRSVDRSSSRNRSDKKKKKKRKHSSDYSRSRSRSNSARKKQKRKRSKSRDKKHSKSKKSKKQRRRSGSPSD